LEKRDFRVQLQKSNKNSETRKKICLLNMYSTDLKETDVKMMQSNELQRRDNRKMYLLYRITQSHINIVFRKEIGRK
jgi:hypothetical protein